MSVSIYMPGLRGPIRGLWFEPFSNMEAAKGRARKVTALPARCYEEVHVSLEQITPNVLPKP